MPSDSPLALDILKEIISEGQKQSIGIVQIRYKPLLPDNIFHGDFDYLLNKSDKDTFFKLAFRKLSENSIPFLIEQKKNFKSVLRIYDTQHRESIILDIWCALEIDLTNKKKRKYLTWDDIEDQLIRDDNGLHFNKNFEALYYLSHLYTKNKNLDSSEVLGRLEHYNVTTNNNKNINTIYSQLLENGNIRNAAASAHNELERLGVISCRDFDELHLGTTIDLYTSKLHHAVKRWRSRGNVIAFVGPDGAGKTTIIEAYRETITQRSSYYRFKKLFRKSVAYKLLLPILRKQTEKRLGHTPAKNQIDDLHGRLIFLISLVRSPLIFIKRIWHHFILADRYFYDFLLSGLRTDTIETCHHEHQKYLLKFMPVPRCLVQLDAKNDVILNRKEELDSADIDLIRNSVFDMYLQKPSPYYIYLNTSIPLNYCISALSHFSDTIGIKSRTHKPNHSPDTKATPLKLDRAQLIGTGHERDCYEHPDDKQLCIKVEHTSKGSRKQNLLDHYYLTNIFGHNHQLKHIPRCYGWVNTEQGSGLTFERISGKNNSRALPLQEALETSQLSCNEAKSLLDEVYVELYENGIILADASINNIIVGATDNGDTRLFVVDGLGARRYGLKIKLRAHSLWISRRKLIKQWPILLRQLDKHC